MTPPSLACPLPAHKCPSDSLAAPAEAGQGVCTSFSDRRVKRLNAARVARHSRVVAVYVPGGRSDGLHGPAIFCFLRRGFAFNTARLVPGALFVERCI